MLRKKIKLAVIVSIVALVLAIAAFSTYAYFTTVAYVYTEDGESQVAHLGMNLSLLFDKLNQGLDGTELPFVDPETGENYEFDHNATWGTAENPYVISDIRHLQNLSALQDIGYFYDLMIVDNFDSAGNYYGNKTKYPNANSLPTGAATNSKPYFLVCTKEGTPVTIDGTGIEIKPIGNEEYPFIGEIAGAPVAGSTNVTVQKGSGENKTPATLSSDTSTIFNITILSKRVMPDHGIFGYVSYLGDAPDNYPKNDKNELTGSFYGYVSHISGLLMADVSLVVKDENFVDTTIAWNEWFADHVFSFSDLLTITTGTDGKKVATLPLPTTVPCETNHIGILAGHVNYVDVADISVYYSNDDIVCIDLNDSTEDVNYFSSTGVVGYVYSMNPQYEGNVIQIGTGSSSVGLGTLGGGGSASGVNPGYVLAADMYDTFAQYSKPPAMTTDQLPLYVYGTDGDGNEMLGIMIYASLDEDENPMFMDEFGRQIFPVNADNNGYYVSGGWQYKQYTTGTNWKYVKLADSGFFYNQSEIRGFDADGNFVTSAYYYLSITSKGPFVLERKDEKGEVLESYTFTYLKGESLKRTSPDLKLGDTNNTDMYLYSAKNSKGEALCAQWYRDRMILSWFGEFKEATGRYYFNDGVFTFALSNMRDVICEIWPKAGDLETVPTIQLSDEWDIGRLDDDYTWYIDLTPVETVTSGKDYVLGFMYNDQLYLVQLQGGDDGTVTVSTYNSIVGTTRPQGTDSTTGSYWVNVGKQRDDRKLFDDYVLRYNETLATKNIYSGAQSEIALGVRAYTGKATGTSLRVYAGSTETASSTTWSDLYAYAYSYKTVLNKVAGGWNVVFPANSVEYWYFENAFIGIGSWHRGYYRSETNYLYYNETSLGVGDAGTATNRTFQLYEVTSRIQPLETSTAPNAMIPVEDENNVNVLANKYVLWPQTTTSGATTRTDTTYALIDVGKLGYDSTQGHGTWRYESGEYLYELPDALKYMFSLVNGANYGTVYGATLGGDYDVGNAFVKATLGSDGSQAFIPMGCISFKVNKKPAADDPIKIRVIVAVPTSGTVNGLSHDEDYYFGLWRNELVSGDSQNIAFEKNGTIAKFELPRSQPLFVGQESTPTDQTSYNNPIQVQYDANGNGVIDGDELNTTYFTYFQGETVLVAYEFNVTEAGVYTLGATNGPMQIVYFSADGVASLGRDGTGGAYLQGIDFVYDTVGYSSADKIVTVTMTPTNTTDPNKDDYVDPDTEDYNYYYESGCIMHFDNDVQNQNDYVKIYHEEIYLRRYYKAPSQAEGTTAPVQRTVLSFTVKNSSEVSQLKSNRYVKCEPYALKSDEVITTYYVDGTIVINQESSRAK